MALDVICPSRLSRTSACPFRACLINPTPSVSTSPEKKLLYLIDSTSARSVSCSPRLQTLCEIFRRTPTVTPRFLRLRASSFVCLLTSLSFRPDRLSAFSKPPTFKNGFAHSHITEPATTLPFTAVVAGSKYGLQE